MRPGHPRPGARCWRPRSPSSSRRTRPGRGNWPGATPSTYLSLPNYTDNLRTLGFGDDDIGGGGSDRLIDAVIPWGDAETIAAAVGAHHDAGADHVCVQVVADREAAFPLDGYRELATILLAG